MGKMEKTAEDNLNAGLSGCSLEVGGRSDSYPSDDSDLSCRFYGAIRLGKAEAKFLSIINVAFNGRGYRNRGRVVGRTAHKHDLRVRNGRLLV